MWAFLVAFNRRGRKVRRGLYQLPRYFTVYQAEGVAQMKSVSWTKVLGRREGKWAVASDSLAVLASLKSGRGMPGE